MKRTADGLLWTPRANDGANFCGVCANAGIANETDEMFALDDPLPPPRIAALNKSKGSAAYQIQIET